MAASESKKIEKFCDGPRSRCKEALSKNRAASQPGRSQKTMAYPTETVFHPNPSQRAGEATPSKNRAAPQPGRPRKTMVCPTETPVFHP
jgi:hypothetical protein